MRAALNRQGHFGWAGRTTDVRPEGRHLYLHQEHLKLSRAQLARSSDFRKLAGRFISYQRDKIAFAKSHMKATYVSYGAGIVSCTNTWLLLALAPSPARPLSPQSKSAEAGNATISFCIHPGREIP
ncbi:hypothetical protein D3C87_1519560 [compost metagenome]